MNELHWLVRQDIIHPVDYHFALFLGDLSGFPDLSVMLAGALVSQATGGKHVCLPLADYAGKILATTPDGSRSLQCPSLEAWRKALLDSPVAGVPGEFKPLILDERNRLYLYRYRDYETLLVDDIRRRAESGFLPVDANRLKESLKRFFPDDPGPGSGSRAMAAVVAVFKKICIITGGPGTGKTTTVGRILAVLLEQPGNQKARICLAAPTGKAAMRLGESIRFLKDSLDLSPEVKKAFPEAPRTIHRLLGPISGSNTFRHDQNNPLPADVVVVDEASMVDVALMAKLVQAVPAHARLILMGDKDQLASVEAGSVLGDICSGASPEDASAMWVRFFEEDFNAEKDTNLDRLSKASGNPLSSCILQLNRNFRFGENHVLEALSRAVRKGDFEQYRETANQCFPEFLEVLHRNGEKRDPDELKSLVLAGYSPFLQADDPSQALDFFGRFRILCAVNRGWWGVEGINRTAETLLMHAGLIRPDRAFYVGRPVLILENDYSLSLFNGDTGLIWKEKGARDEDIHAYFSDREGRLRRISPQRLPRHETAFAMTIHKSQGSEFDSVLMVLPENDVPGLTRELLYTGITRARSKLTVWANDNLMKTALLRKTQRHSGLEDRLWK
jgi:exodeoxyribonuclease V alpha subunit